MENVILSVIGVVWIGLVIFKARLEKQEASLRKELDLLLSARMDQIRNEIIIVSMAVWPDRREEFEKMIIKEKNDL